MEKQMRAEREKRANVLTSEGVRDANINQAEGQKQQVIKASEARKQSGPVPPVTAGLSGSTDHNNPGMRYSRRAWSSECTAPFRFASSNCSR
jgi:regulator of protease activity HflC (stomatin/prohibitin superfamily)